jgi:hypothetical protein
MSTDTPDYVVIRPSPDLPDGFLPADLDGKWFDRAQLPAKPEDLPTGLVSGVAVPSGRFEVRDWDGAVAEVWEVRP